MAETVSVQPGPAGAGRPELSPEALDRLARAYALLRTWAARRRELWAQGEQIPAELDEQVHELIFRSFLAQKAKLG